MRLRQIFYGVCTVSIMLMPSLLWANATPENPATSSVDTLMSKNLKDLLNMPVTSATLTPTTQKISPGNPYIITDQEMDRMGVMSIADAIDKMIPGMNIAMYPNFNQLVSARGLVTDSNLKTLLMSDGVDIGDHNNSGFSGGDIASPFMGDIDRIEVMLGPGALQLGSGAINGYVNRISATGASKPGLIVKQQYGSGNARLTEISYGKVQNADLNWFVYGGYYRNDGVAPHFNLMQDQLIAHGGTGLNYTQPNTALIAPAATYYDNIKVGATGDNFRLSSRIQYGNEDRGDFLFFDIKSFYMDTSTASSGVDTPLTFPTSNQWSAQAQATLNDLNNNGWGYSPFLFYRDQILSVSPETRLNFNATNKLDLVPFYQKLVQYEYPSDWFKDQVNQLGLDASQLKDLSFGSQDRYGLKAVYNNTSFKDNSISIGSEIKHVNFRAANNWNGFDSAMLAYESTNQTWDQYAVFAEDLLTFDRLSVIPGIRYDVLNAGQMSTTQGYTVNQETTAHVTPRFAMAYQFSPDDTLKASYSEGFRFVDADVRQWFYNNPYAGQPDKLLPETSKDYEITYDKYLPQIKTQCDVTTYYDSITHARGWIDAVNNYGNASKLIQGIGQEYRIKYLPSDKLELYLAYGWSRPLDSFETSLYVANHNNTWTKYPEQMLKTGGSYTIGKFTFGSMLKLTSGTYVHDRVTDPLAQSLYNGWSLDGDINVKYAVTANMHITLTVKDAIMVGFNQYYNYWQGQYPAMGLRPEDPQVYVSVDYKF